jgi:hypothetical protein
VWVMEKLLKEIKRYNLIERSSIEGDLVVEDQRKQQHRLKNNKCALYRSFQRFPRVL